MENASSELSVLEEIGNLSKEGLVVYSLEENRVLYVNANAIALTDLRENAPQEEVVAVVNRLEASEAEYLKTRFNELITKSFTRAQIKLQGTGGSELHVACSAYLLSDASIVVAVLNDVTRHYKHREYLVKYTAKKNTLMDTLVHHISGALNLMQHLSVEAEKYVSASGDDNLKTYLSLVQANSRHCLKIINELVLTENQEAPTIATRKARLDIVKQVSAMVDELKQSQPNRTITFYSTQPAILISTDEIKVMLVINNLLSNALKYSREQDSIAIRLAETEDNVTISVIDNGIGIPDELKPLLFERQTESGRAGLLGEKSSGLGLLISKNLIELIGGQIGFESKAGIGSTFYITLPKL